MGVHAPELGNEFVTLSPLAVADASALFEAAGDPETFRWFTTPPSPWSVGGMERYCERLLRADLIRAYTVRLADSGRVVGSTTYSDHRPGHVGAEIGWTWYAPGVRGTPVNPACKRLLLGHAFDGGLFGEHAVRVCLKTDARNERSRRAILKLGAAFEGLLRSHLIMPDGHRRDSAMYSVLESEWPAVRAGLDARLAGA